MDADVLWLPQAAEQLGVGSARVRQLVSAGSLPVRRSSAGWLIGADAVADRSGAARAGRPASPRTVWAILCILSSALAPDAANPPGCLLGHRRLRHHPPPLLPARPQPADTPRPAGRVRGTRGAAERGGGPPGPPLHLFAEHP